MNILFANIEMVILGLYFMLSVYVALKLHLNGVNKSYLFLSPIIPFLLLFIVVISLRKIRDEFSAVGKLTLIFYILRYYLEEFPILVARLGVLFIQIQEDRVHKKSKVIQSKTYHKNTPAFTKKPVAIAHTQPVIPFMRMFRKIIDKKDFMNSMHTKIS